MTPADLRKLMDESHPSKHRASDYKSAWEAIRGLNKADRRFSHALRNNLPALIELWESAEADEAAKIKDALEKLREVKL